jgi:hypothetical protein
VSKKSVESVDKPTSPMKKVVETAKNQESSTNQKEAVKCQNQILAVKSQKEKSSHKVRNSLSFY